VVVAYGLVALQLAQVAAAPPARLPRGSARGVCSAAL
jgi:hypothetical protein